MSKYQNALFIVHCNPFQTSGWVLPQLPPAAGSTTTICDRHNSYYFHIIHCCYQIERPPEYKVKSYTQVGYANAKLMTQILSF